MKSNYDIVVVGAGPAGSMAAKSAAERGVEVLLIENHAQIGVPVICGEGVSTEGLTRFLQPKPSWISSRVVGVVFTSPSGKSFKVHHPETGFILERKVFDRDLAHLASRAGAEVVTRAQAVGLIEGGDGIGGVEILHRDEKVTVRAKVIIGADGVSSSVGRWAGIDTRLSPSSLHTCAQYLLSGVEVEAGYLEFFVGNSEAPGGYGWVFPKGEELANVGVGISPLRTEKRPIDYLNRYVAKRFPEASILESMVGSVPTTPLNRVSVENVLLVGDAARVADPLSGAGIANSLITGEIAGRTAASAVRDGNSRSTLKGYEREVRRTLGKELSYRARARKVYLKLTDEDLEAIFDFGEKNFGEETVTEVKPSEVLNSLIRSSPRFLKLARHLL